MFTSKSEVLVISIFLILFFENLVHSEIKTTSILDFTCVCELYQIIQLCCIIDFLLFYLQGINSAYINFIYFDWSEVSL